MIIDFYTGQVIPPDPKLTVTQSLVKSTDISDTSCIDFKDPKNNNWAEVLDKNSVLPPNVIINQFKAVLLSFLKGETLDPQYCEYMIGQCENWEVSDQFVIAE